MTFTKVHSSSHLGCVLYEPDSSLEGEIGLQTSISTHILCSGGRCTRHGSFGSLKHPHGLCTVLDPLITENSLQKGFCSGTTCGSSSGSPGLFLTLLLSHPQQASDSQQLDLPRERRLSCLHLKLHSSAGAQHSGMRN